MSAEENQADDANASPRTAEDQPSEKGVRWDTSVDQQETNRAALSRSRKQSMVGTSGYVSQLLDEYVADEPEKVERKPIRQQSVDERRASIKAVETDMQFYMKKSSSDAPRRSIAFTSERRPTMTPLMSAESAGKPVEKVSEKDVMALPTEDDRPTSDWKPSHLLETIKSEEQQARSWVGTYIVGKDYWSPGIDYDRQSYRGTVNYMDDGKTKPWYEMPIGLSSVNDTTLQSMKSRCLDRIEALKAEIDEEFEEKSKYRRILATAARSEPPTLDQWPEEFKECFRDATKASKFSHTSYITMPNVDKWLEKADILDYSDITLVHTGLCFLSCGGRRHKGLSFDEFCQFVQVIARIKGMPVRDVIRRLQACQREPGDYTEI